MKSRAIWFIVVLAALTFAAAFWWRNRTPPAAPSAAPSTAAAPLQSTPTAATPAAPAVASPAASAGAAAKKPQPEVAIQDGKTIDFSSGVAVVKDDAKQKAVIDQSVKEMDSAAKDVTFGPPLQKKAEPAPAPPKP